MTADLDTLLIALHVLADELLPRRPRARRRPKITDAELVCLAVAQMLLDIPSERRFLRFARSRQAVWIALTFLFFAYVGPIPIGPPPAAPGAPA